MKQKGLCLDQILSSLYKLGLVAPQKGNNRDYPFSERITSGPTANMTWIKRFLRAVLPIAALCVFGYDLHILCASQCVCAFLTPGTSVRVHPVKRLARKPSKFVVL